MISHHTTNPIAVPAPIASAAAATPTLAIDEIQTTAERTGQLVTHTRSVRCLSAGLRLVPRREFSPACA